MTHIQISIKIHVCCDYAHMFAFNMSVTTLLLYQVGVAMAMDVGVAMARRRRRGCGIRLGGGVLGGRRAVGRTRRVWRLVCECV